MTADLLILSIGFLLTAVGVVYLVRRHDWVCLALEVAFFAAWSQWLVTTGANAWGYAVAAVLAVEGLVFSRRGRRDQAWMLLAVATYAFCYTLAGVA